MVNDVSNVSDVISERLASSVNRRRCVNRSRHWRYVYILYKIIYSCLFTFTTFYILVLLLNRSDLSVLRRISSIRDEQKKEIGFSRRSIEEDFVDEMSRQQRLVTDMRNACSCYENELMETLSAKINELISIGGMLKTTHAGEFFVVYARLNRTLDRMKNYESALRAYQAKHEQHLSAFVFQATSSYTTYLNALTSNQWLAFRFQLFNSSFWWNEGLVSSEGQKETEDLDVEFASLFDIHHINDVRKWSAQFWQRFSAVLYLSKFLQKFLRFIVI